MQSIHLKRLIIVGAIFLFCSPMISILSTGEEQPMLILSAPSSVREGDNFDVSVADNHSMIITHATVKFLGTPHLTGINGMVTFTAPLVDSNTTFTITANKTGYINDSIDIMIIDTNPSTPQLSINTPQSIDERSIFQATVMADNLPVPSVTLSFNGKIFTTNNNGNANLTAPSVIQDTPYIIVANKIGYQNGETWITVKNTTQSLTELFITAPQSVTEGASFLVTITANSIPMSSVIVEFDDNTYPSDINGEVELIAPIVPHIMALTIIAHKEGYLQAIGSITILKQQQTQGWIYGRISDTNQESLEGVNVCTLTSETENCTFTDDQGEYNISLPSGIYSVIASKSGYVTSSIYTVYVWSRTATEVNFILEKIEEITPQKEIKDPGDFIIAWGTQNNLIGATITTNPELTTSKLYKTDLSLMLLPSQKGKIVFTVSGPEGAKGTVVALKINNSKEVLNTSSLNLTKLVITFDGIPIQMSSSYEDIFDESKSQIGPMWTALLNENELTVFIGVSHFSTHTIEISTTSLPSIFSSITAIFSYIVVAVIALFLFVGLGEISKRL